jgi:hypothetical protein
MTFRSAALAWTQARSTRALRGGRMDAFNAGNRLRAQSFESLLNDALDFLLRRLEVIEGCAVTVAESHAMLFAADDIDHLFALPDFRQGVLVRRPQS